MHTLMIDSRLLVTKARDVRRHGLARRLRNPPRTIRRVAVGAFFAIPGAVAGLLLALLMPASCALPAAFAGVVVGFACGSTLERR